MFFKVLEVSKLLTKHTNLNDMPNQTLDKNQLDASSNQVEVSMKPETNIHKSVIAADNIVSPPESAPAKQESRMSKSLKLQAKLLISLLLFGSLFIFGKVDLSKSIQTALSANPIFIAMAILSFIGSTVLIAVRWQLLAKAVGFERNLFKLSQYCYVGLFFNLFLPSTVGGDFSRCYYLSKGSGKYVDAFYSVLADRTIGIAVLFFMASFGLLISPERTSLPFELKLPIYVGTVLIFGLMPFAPKLTKTILGESNWLTKQFNSSTAGIYWQDKKLILLAFAWSMAFQLVVVFSHISLAYSLGITNVPIWYYFVFYPCVAVLGFITPTFNGIGIREWAYTYFLKMMNVSDSHAGAYAIMWLGMTTLASLFGGLVYVGGHFKKISQKEVEELSHQSI
jgi:uncharacterized protein (TIRG00374 family)